MIASLLAWFGLLTALAYLPMTEDAPSPLRSILKALPLTCFALAAVAAQAGPYLIAGLFLSMLGDVALSRAGRSTFLYGLASFALAHVVYALHFLTLSDAPLWASFLSNAPLALLVLVAALSTEIWLIPHTGKLRWAVTAYVVAIALMGLAALTLPLGLAFLGAFFFIFSDMLLAVQLFRASEDNPLNQRIGWAIWISYVAGQSTILGA